MIAFIALLIMLVDQGTKYIVQQYMELGQTIAVIPNVFHFTYILNPGAAFGLFPYQNWIFLIIVVALFIAFFMFRNKIELAPFYFKLGISFLLGGSLGNAIDRIRIQSVIDFFDWRIWPIFNIADIAICVGTFLMMLYFWREEL